MDLPITIQPIEKYTVVEFRTASLMDQAVLDNIAQAIYRLVDVEDKRAIVLDFEKVTYLNSSALGMLMALRKKLGALPHSSLVLCSVGPKLMELIKIVRLERVLQIKPTQKEAVKVLIP